MPTKISEMSDGAALDGTELFETVQGGASKRSVISRILTYVRGDIATTMPRLPRSTVAATGTDLGTAAQLVLSLCTVTAADGTVGVKLPATPTAGDWMIVKNDAGSALKVYPDAAATINAVAAHGALSMDANTSVLFWADSATQWWTLPLLPS